MTDLALPSEKDDVKETGSIFRFIWEEDILMKKNNKGYLGSKDVAWILDLSPDDVVGLARPRQLMKIK